MSAAETQTPARRPPWLITAADDPASAAGAVAALGSFMCVAEAGRAPAGDEPGAIVFDRVDDALLALTRETSRAGHRRVLGIATGPEPPAGGDCWALLREGMADVVIWEDPAAVRARIDRWQAVDELVASPLVAEHLVGASPTWRSVLRDVVEIAHFSDVDVLITGESGTGKELTAQLIHTLDPRPRKGELVVVDCTTIVPSLSGSEFFGHERGAFTGAVAARDGAFALADGGTLFLDEVGELPLALQAERGGRARSRRGHGRRTQPRCLISHARCTWGCGTPATSCSLGAADDRGARRRAAGARRRGRRARRGVAAGLRDGHARAVDAARRLGSRRVDRCAARRRRCAATRRRCGPAAACSSSTTRRPPESSAARAERCPPGATAVADRCAITASRGRTTSCCSGPTGRGCIPASSCTRSACSGSRRRPRGLVLGDNLLRAGRADGADPWESEQFPVGGR